MEPVPSNGVKIKQKLLHLIFTNISRMIERIWFFQLVLFFLNPPDGQFGQLGLITSLKELY